MNRCNGLFMRLNRRSKDLDLHTLPQVLCHHTRVVGVVVVGTLRDPNLHQVVEVGAAVGEGEEELVQVQDPEVEVEAEAAAPAMTTPSPRRSTRSSTGRRRRGGA